MRKGEQQPNAPEQYSPEELIEATFGREVLQEAANIATAIYGEMRTRLAQIGGGEGSSDQQREQVREYLDMWNEFYHGVMTVTSSTEHHSPERLRDALAGASALLAPEITHEGRQDAERLIKGLTKRYN